MYAYENVNILISEFGFVSSYSRKKKTIIHSGQLFWCFNIYFFVLCVCLCVCVRVCVCVCVLLTLAFVY